MDDMRFVLHVTMKYTNVMENEGIYMYCQRLDCLNGATNKLSLFESPPNRSLRIAKGSSSGTSSSSLSPRSMNECEGGPSSSESRTRPSPLTQVFSWCATTVRKLSARLHKMKRTQRVQRVKRVMSG